MVDFEASILVVEDAVCCVLSDFEIAVTMKVAMVCRLGVEVQIRGNHQYIG